MKEKKNRVSSLKLKLSRVKNELENIRDVQKTEDRFSEEIEETVELEEVPEKDIENKKDKPVSNKKIKPNIFQMDLKEKLSPKKILA